MLERLATLVTGRHSRWVVIGTWLLLTVVFAPLGLKLPDRTNQEFLLPKSSQSVQASRILRERLPGGDLRPVLLVYHRAGGLTADDRARILADAKEAARVPLATTALPPFGRGGLPGQASPDGAVAFTIVPLTAKTLYRVTPSIDALREIATSDGELDVHVTGTPALASDFDTAVKSADSKLLLATGALVLFLLLAVYRSPVLALVPLTIVGIAYSIATGVIYLLARRGLSVDSTSSSLLPVLMFGAGTDYCLLLVARYRKALRAAPSRAAAVAAAVPVAAPAMIASGLTVAAALVAMLAGVLGINRALGPVNAIGVVIVLLASLTLLPALLSIVRPPARWLQETADEAPGIWTRVGERIRARPALFLVSVVAVLAMLAAGLSLYRVNANILEVFRSPTDSTRGADSLLTAFPPGVLGPTTVVVERTDGPLRLTDVAIVSDLIAKAPGVAAVSPVTRRADNNSAVTFSFAFADNPYASPALDRLRSIRDRLDDLPAGLRALTGDGSAARADLEDAANRDLKVVAPLVLGLVLLTLMLLLRAVVMPLFLLGTVILSFLATSGLCLLVFRVIFDQQSYDPVLPLIVFIFLVALGSDYNIFLMSRVREEAAVHGTHEGMLRALVATGPVITSAGVILAGTFTVLTVIPVWDLFEIGFAVGVGVLIDTFIVRTVVVPAGTWLLGERAWWPSRLARESPPDSRLAAAGTEG